MTSRSIVWYAIWLLKVLLGAFFIYSGASKLAGAERHILLFEELGIGHWFRYATGGIEVVAGLLLLVPPTSAIGALLLMCISVGAGAALLHLHRAPTPAIVTLALSLLIAVADRTALIALVRRVSGRPTP